MGTYDNHHEHRADATLQESEEESLCIERPVVFADHCQDQADAPDGNNPRSNSFDRISLCEYHAWVSPDDEAEIEDGGRHGVSISTEETKVLPQPE
jgi:hypothetical protein